MDYRNLHSRLEEHFGFTRFRPGQAQAVKSTMRGRDTIVVMPTGSGKSLCYQLPALELKGVTVVVGPLIALAVDQAAQLNERENHAIVLNSTVRAADVREAHAKILNGQAEFVFTTPERLQGTDLCEVLRKRGVDILVIDEAHCVSQWGHDFRPDYLSLHWVRKQLGNPPVLAMTATAPADTLADIQRTLRLENPEIIITGINRANISLGVTTCSGDADKRKMLLELLRGSEGQVICYVATTKAAEELSSFLEDSGIDAVFYHGRRRQTDRTAAQDAFMSNRARVMVATNAFGLGIDKPDIRQVVHYHLPGSIEAYYQEFGRSGRDGLPAHCTLLYDPADRQVQRLFVHSGVLDSSDLVNAHHAFVRTTTDLASQECDLKDILLRSPIKRSKLTACLQLLASLGIVAPIGKSRWQLAESNIERRQLDWMADQSRERREQQAIRLQELIDYAESSTCRWHRIIKYFEDDSVSSERCLRCDHCQVLNAVA